MTDERPLRVTEDGAALGRIADAIKGETADVTMCDALVPSPLDSGQQLACFRRPHPGDPWHYDTRGLGVAFRVRDPLTLDIEARLGVTPEQAAAEQERPELRAELLPLRALGLDGQVLDIDTMRTAAPEVRRRLIDNLRTSALNIREARGPVVVPEDTYDLVRRLTAGGEVLRMWASAFSEAATEADALVAEEAVTAMGEQDGALNASLFVPDGVGQRIAVRNDFASGESVWDTASLVGWLIEDEATDDKCSCSPPPDTDGPERDCPIHGDPMTVARVVARNVVARLIGLDGMPGLGRFTPGAKPVEALRKKLSELGRDAEAGIIRQVRHVGPRVYRGVKITREEA